MALHTEPLQRCLNAICRASARCCGKRLQSKSGDAGGEVRAYEHLERAGNRAPFRGCVFIRTLARPGAVHVSNCSLYSARSSKFFDFLPMLVEFHCAPHLVNMPRSPHAVYVFLSSPIYFVRKEHVLRVYKWRSSHHQLSAALDT